VRAQLSVLAQVGEVDVERVRGIAGSVGDRGHERPPVLVRRLKAHLRIGGQFRDRIAEQPVQERVEVVDHRRLRYGRRRLRRGGSSGLAEGLFSSFHSSFQYRRSSAICSSSLRAAGSIAVVLSGGGAGG